VLSEGHILDETRQAKINTVNVTKNKCRGGYFGCEWWGKILEEKSF
jgi:hypothetical protein